MRQIAHGISLLAGSGKVAPESRIPNSDLLSHASVPLFRLLVLHAALSRRCCFRVAIHLAAVGTSVNGNPQFQRQIPTDEGGMKAAPCVSSWTMIVPQRRGSAGGMCWTLVVSCGYTRHDLRGQEGKR
ncbi:unnamed protein product [Closterium sp. Naga37s-1]|nr:unnamed protein product [Closterium sp. Naga37s-1]